MFLKVVKTLSFSNILYRGSHPPEIDKKFIFFKFFAVFITCDIFVKGMFTCFVIQYLHLQ